MKVPASSVGDLAPYRDCRIDNVRHRARQNPWTVRRASHRTTTDSPSRQQQWSASQQDSPRSPSRPSFTSSAAIPNSATGSAHHRPSAVLSATPARLTTDSQKHADVWNEWGGRGAGEHVRAQDMGNTFGSGHG